jgi:hypothetical protein
MATDRQIAANRRNGSLGRGPKTSAGKARSSRNALKHGLSIPVNRDKTLRSQIEVLARILAQSEAAQCPPIRLKRSALVERRHCGGMMLALRHQASLQPRRQRGAAINRS